MGFDVTRIQRPSSRAINSSISQGRFSLRGGDEALESGIFLLQLAQASHIANLQLAVSLAPGIYRLLAYSVTLRNIRCGARIGLAQNFAQSGLRQIGSFSWLSLLAAENHLLKKLVVRKTWGRPPVWAG